MNKIILDSTLGLGGDSIMADKLTLIGYDVEIRNFPNKESILESKAPVFLSGESIVMAYEDKNYDDFETWLGKFNQKLGTLTILSDTELFHPIKFVRKFFCIYRIAVRQINGGNIKWIFI